MRKGAFQTFFPARSLIVQIRTSSSQFASWIYEYSVGGSYYPDEGSLREYFPASHAGAMGDMFSSNNLLRHPVFSRVSE
jgi:hypothetical protein